MDKNLFIAKQPEIYLETQGKSLEQKLEQVELSEEEEQGIISQATTKTIRDKALGLFKVGEVINTLLNWNDEIDKELTEAKKAVLLEKYFIKVDDQEQAITQLKNLLKNLNGNVLFNKIIRIIDDYPPDSELIEHLSSVLKYIISKENFRKLFEQHKFALAQIERLTPQALTILADYQSYPRFQLNHSVSIGPKVTSEWQPQFVSAYCASKGISNSEYKNRISHSITELQTQGFIEAYKTQEKIVACEITNIGKDLLPYLT